MNNIEETVKNIFSEYHTGEVIDYDYAVELVMKYLAQKQEVDENVLDELAIEEFEGPWKYPTEYHNGNYVYELIDAYKTGYRKAKEEIEL